MPFLARDDNKIALAMDAMRQLLEIQSTRQSWQFDLGTQELKRFDLTSSCGEHHDCEGHLQSIGEIIAIRYPGCRSRRYVRTTGEVVFVVLSDFSELSPRLAIAKNECQAWKAALDAHCTKVGD